MNPDYYIQHDKMPVKVKWLLLSYFDDDLHCLLFANQNQDNNGDCWHLQTCGVGINESLEKRLSLSVWDFANLKNFYFNEHKTISLYKGGNDRVLYIRYYVLVPKEQLNFDLVQRGWGFWFTKSNLPRGLNGNDTNFIVDVIESFKENINHQPILSNLLPKKFTFLEMQKMFEAIFSIKLDNGNFRKKIHKLDILEDLCETKSGCLQKPPKIYKLNLPVYKKVLRTGKLFRPPRNSVSN